MSWYRKSQVGVQTPPQMGVQSPAQIRRRNPDENYTSVGHYLNNTNAQYYGVPGLILWTWTETDGLDYIEYDKEKHKHMDFAHGRAMPMPNYSRNKGRIYQGRLDRSVGKCSLTCTMRPPEKLIQDLVQTFGTDFEIINFSDKRFAFNWKRYIKTASS